jgi:hypothetical protein
MERPSNRGMTMLDWIGVGDSHRVSAVAYDSSKEIIYVRFCKDGIEWWYGNCPPHLWEEFIRPGVSKGRFIHDVLDAHPNGRFA